MRFWKKKRFWIILGIGGLLLLGYLWVSSDENFATLDISQSVSPDILTKDKEPPTLVIESPEQGTWMSRDFRVFVFEEDLETAIAMDSCVFQVCAYGVNDEERCTGTIQRECGDKTPVITVGPKGMCSFEGREACFVYVGAQDLAGNKGGSQRFYHIDFTPPSIGESVLQQQEEEGYMIQGRVQDENIIARCSLYENDRYVKDMKLEENCKENCKVSLSFKQKQLESSTLFIRCSDIAGNTGDGPHLFLEVNQAPFINSCRVIPTKGNLETEFRFFVVAEDPNQDSLSYVWELGNGNSGNSNETIYSYSTPGTYMPQVIVRDPEGLFAKCSTAWVVVE